MAFSALIRMLRELVASVEREVGKRFDLKCLVARDPEDISWELVLYAPWLDEDESRRISFLYERIVSKLDDALIIDFSGLIPTNRETDMIRTLRAVRRASSPRMIIEDETIFQVDYPFAKLIIFLE
jgi:hypothetical protein